MTETRILSKLSNYVRDYERLPENHEAMVYVAMIRLMLRRLENNCRRWKQETA